MSASVDPRVARLRQQIAHFPKTPGVYLMKDLQGQVLYIGKSRDLRARVSSYFQDSADLLNTRGPEIARMATLVADIDFLDCDTEVDALLTENRLIKDIQPPFNAQLRDGKSFPYIQITTGEDFPGVYVTREPRRKGVRLFGPFLSAHSARQAVNALQRVLRFRTCELDIRADDDQRRFFRPCLLHSIKQCTAPCADRISREAYREDIKRLIKTLRSKRSNLLRELRREMAAAAAEQRYEDAAMFRDRLRAIESLSLSGTPDEHVQPEVFYIDPTAGLEKLQRLLKLPKQPRIVEGIDIATLQGESSVGSLVCFIDGRPFKSGYRRYKIKTVAGVDDYAMIREVIVRRYKHAVHAQELFPDVILIDGGLGQLHAALEAFNHLQQVIEAETGTGVTPPMVISLAKREELIYVQARSEPYRLSRNNEALRLLQQVRDEAHRFGQHYHHILRRKRTFEEEVAQGRRPPSAKKAGRAGGTSQPKKGKAKSGPTEVSPPQGPANGPPSRRRQNRKGDSVVEPDYTQLPPEELEE